MIKNECIVSGYILAPNVLLDFVLMQYLHVLQNSKRYMFHLTVQVQSNSQVTDIPLTERQRLKDDHFYQRP